MCSLTSKASCGDILPCKESFIMRRKRRCSLLGAVFGVFIGSVSKYGGGRRLAPPASNLDYQRHRLLRFFGLACSGCS